MQFDDRDQCDVQWVNLTDSSVFQSVYINTGLVWARRSLHTSGRNSVVGWAARVSTLLYICMCVCICVCVCVFMCVCVCVYLCVCVCVCVCVYVIVQLIGDIVSCKESVANRSLCKVKHVFA